MVSISRIIVDAHFFHRRKRFCQTITVIIKTIWTISLLSSTARHRAADPGRDLQTIQGHSYASGTRAMRSSKTRNSSSHRRSSQKHREQSAAQNGAAAGGSAHAQRHHSSEADHRSVKEKISEAKKSRKLSVGGPGGRRRFSNRQTEQRQ